MIAELARPGFKSYLGRFLQPAAETAVRAAAQARSAAMEEAWLIEPQHLGFSTRSIILPL